ncbi:MAG: hypothetical protein HYS07_05290 [Chlamydiae bacterium]|nr:hypothetical protein [Chlamydiota bacterium]MBI3278001.1 hypothetical protein [Chlamydiota bacterium]
MATSLKNTSHHLSHDSPSDFSESLLTQIRRWNLKEKVFLGIFFIALVSLGMFFNFLLQRHAKSPLQKFQGNQNVSLQQMHGEIIELPDGRKIPIHPEVLPVEVSGVHPVMSGSSSVLPMRIYENRYLGFSMRVPEGWQIAVDLGQILVRRDPMASAAILIRPILLIEGIKLLDFFQTQFQIQAKALQNLNAHFSVNGLKEISDQVTAELEGSVSGVKIQGQVKAIQKNLKGIYQSVWAPQEEWEMLRPTLEAVSASFKSFQSKPMNLYQGQVFKISYPKNWNVKETEYNLEVVSEDEADGFLVNFFIYLPGNPTAQELLKIFEIHQTRINSIDTLSEREYPEFIDPLGQRWKVAEREVTFNASGSGLKKGILRGAVVSQGNSFSGVMTLRYATLSRWDEVKMTLAEIEQSFRVLRPDRLGGGGKNVQFPKNIPMMDAQSLPNPNTGEKNE